MIDWFKVADEIKKPNYPNASTAHTAQTSFQSANDGFQSTKSNVVNFPTKPKYFPTIPRAKALRLFDELAMTPPVSLDDWAAACVANGLSRNAGKFRASIANDLVKMNRLIITDDGFVLDAEKSIPDCQILDLPNKHNN